MGRPIIKFSKRYGKVLGSINPDNHYPLYMFMYIIIMYALENNSAFNALSKHKLSAIHFIRMQVDCCLEVYACLLYRDKERFFNIAVRLNSTTIKIVCSTADFPRSSIFFSFPSPPNQKVMDLEVTPRRISTPFPSPFQDY